MSGAFDLELLGWTPAAVNAVERLRGWTEQAIEQLALTYDQSSGRVGFPIVDATGDELGELLYLPDPSSRRNGRPKVQQPAGVPRQLFPPPESLENSVRELVLAEGEPDQVAAASAYFDAVGVPGVQGWRPDYPARFTGRHWIVYVVFDCDAEGREAAIEVATSLVAAGVDARIVELDQARSDGYDLTDFLRERGASALRTLLDTAEPYAPPTNERDVRIVTLDEFADVDELGADAVLGDDDGPLIPEGGDAMFYGDGGVGKTTLVVDLAFHLAAGDDWLGIAVPKPLRVLLVENEGPRPLFRRKLARKRAAWAGSQIGDRLHVWETPWSRFSFSDPAARAQLAAKIRELAIDVLVVGPVTSAGMDAAGTIAEVRTFLALVDEVRELSGRPVASILVHHEGKGGKVSGAWEGVGDTLVHVTQQGHGKLRVYVQKARWSSAQHATALQLAWAAGDSFTVEEKPELDEDELADRIVAAIAADPGTGWTKIEGLTRGVEDKRRRQIRDRLLVDGVIVNVVKDESGGEVVLDYCPERKRSRLYPADDPTIRHLRRELRREPAADGEMGEKGTAAPGGEGASAASAACGAALKPHAVAPQIFHPLDPVDDAEVERLAELARDAQQELDA